MRGAGIISVAAAAQLMMTRILDDERPRPDLRVRELVIDALVPPNGRPAGAGEIAAAEVGSVVEALVRTGSPSSAPSAALRTR